MICEGSTLLNFLASALMNGVCCMHSMEQEERRSKETRETLRHLISVEYERQRLLEREHYEKLWREHELDAAFLADDRRRLYLAAKMAARDNSLSTLTCPIKRESVVVKKEQVPDRNNNLGQETPNPLIPSLRYIVTDSKELYDDAHEVNTSDRSAPENRDSMYDTPLFPSVLKSPSFSPSTASSLFDEIESDSDDDLDIIPL
jgi:hypothetical protein